MTVRPFSNRVFCTGVTLLLASPILLAINKPPPARPPSWLLHRAGVAVPHLQVDHHMSEASPPSIETLSDEILPGEPLYLLKASMKFKSSDVLLGDLYVLVVQSSLPFDRGSLVGPVHFLICFSVSSDEPPTNN
jgi:hypothetical protein